MSFLKPAARPWSPAQFPFFGSLSAVPRDVLHVLRTTALVEARADQYGDYLRSVFSARGELWRRAVDVWNAEECRHGEVLRRLCEAADGQFDFARCQAAYHATVRYHACDGTSVRGSVAGELVARCVVEALASTFYRVLHDAVADATARAALQALAQDEARHYGLFRAMLIAEEGAQGAMPWWRRWRVGVGRMGELGDDQISRAAWAVDPRKPTYRRGRIAALYAHALFPHYRWRHLRYAARLLAPVLFGSGGKMREVTLAAALWTGVRVRALAARLSCVLRGLRVP